MSRSSSSYAASLYDTVIGMPELALLYTSSFNTNLAAFLVQTKTENIPAMQRSTLPLTQRACWDRATKPSPAAAAGPQPVGPDLERMASAYTCPGMHAMWNSSDKGVLIITHTCSGACSHRCSQPLHTILMKEVNIRYFKVFSVWLRLRSASYCAYRPPPTPICLSCSQVSEPAREPTDLHNTHTCSRSHRNHSSRVIFCFSDLCQTFMHEWIYKTGC